MDFQLFKDILSVVGPLAGVALGSWLSRGNARKLKLGEMRREAYGVILSNLASIQRHLDQADEMIQEDFMRFYEGPAYSSVNGAIAPHHSAASDRFNDDYLILSDAFITAFEAMLSDLKPDAPDESPPEEHERYDGAIRKHRPLLLAIAKREVAKL